MDFAYSARTRQLQALLTDFMNAHVYPNEQRYWDEIEVNTRAGRRWTPRKSELRMARGSTMTPAAWPQRYPRSSPEQLS